MPERKLSGTLTGADHGSLEDRFWRRVIVGNPGECWVWQGHVNRQTGYGRLADRDGYSKVGAHVVSYRIHFGAVPAGMLVRHKCDNRPCVNPSHLEVGTQADNVQDMMIRGRGRGAVPEGPQAGHWYDGQREAQEERSSDGPKQDSLQARASATAAPVGTHAPVL